MFLNFAHSIVYHCMDDGVDGGGLCDGGMNVCVCDYLSDVVCDACDVECDVVCDVVCDSGGEGCGKVK